MSRCRIAILFLAAAPACAQPTASFVPLPPPRPVPIEPAAAPLPPPRPEVFGPGVQALAVPLPAPRPEEFGPPWPSSVLRIGPVPSLRREEFGPPLPPPAKPLAPESAASSDLFEATCVRVLSSGKVLASRVATVTGPNGCGIEAPLMLRAVTLQSGQKVAVEPPALLRCDLAEQLADWVRDDISPVATGRGELLALKDSAAYTCRSRNHVLGAQMSEHGRGDAIDVLAFRFSGGSIGLRQADAHPFWSAIKASACARFMTVLGPGSDGFHEDNLHLDLESRRNGSHYCHWDHP